MFNISKAAFWDAHNLRLNSVLKGAVQPVCFQSAEHAMLLCAQQNTMHMTLA
jgi:hypothetical protein